MQNVNVKVVDIAPLLMNKFSMQKPDETKAKRSAHKLHGDFQ